MARGPTKQQVRRAQTAFHAKVRKAAANDALCSPKARGENSVIVDTLDDNRDPLRLVFYMAPIYASNGECWMKRFVRVFPYLKPSHLFADIPWMPEGAPVRDLFAGIKNGCWDIGALNAYLKENL